MLELPIFEVPFRPELWGLELALGCVAIAVARGPIGVTPNPVAELGCVDTRCADAGAPNVPADAGMLE